MSDTRATFNLANAGIEEARPMLHYIGAFTRERNGRQQAFCGAYVAMTQHSAAPDCPECARQLAQDSKDFESMAAWSNEVDNGKQS